MKGGGIDIDMAGDAERLLTAPTLKAEVKALVNFEELPKNLSPWRMELLAGVR